MTGHGGDEGASSQGGANVSKDRGEVRDSEAGVGDRIFTPSGAGDWKARGGSEHPDGAD